MPAAKKGTRPPLALAASSSAGGVSVAALGGGGSTAQDGRVRMRDYVALRVICRGSFTHQLQLKTRDSVLARGSCPECSGVSHVTVTGAACGAFHSLAAGQLDRNAVEADSWDVATYSIVDAAANSSPVVATAVFWESSNETSL
jgi:hypothetical protein